MTEEQRKQEGCFCGGAGTHFTQMFGSCLSQATREHFHNSRLEFWKGVRSMVDQQIDRLSRQQQKGSTVTVE